MRQKYFDRGKPFPVAISFGDDPLLIMAAGNHIPWGTSEYDYAGGIRGEPYDVITGPSTGLPIHAYAEVAIEGEVLPDTHIKEGPYGEWTGYYASGERSEQMLRVHRIMYRTHPIVTGAPSSRPPGGSDDGLIRSAFIWNYMEKAGVPDVMGVALYQGRFISVISIRQRYPGHAKQAAFVASQCATGAYLGRYVVVVDDDIDIQDDFAVDWALSWRVRPDRDIYIEKDVQAVGFDPSQAPPTVPQHHPSRLLGSRVAIDATKKHEYPAIAIPPKDQLDWVNDHWREYAIED